MGLFVRVASNAEKAATAGCLFYFDCSMGVDEFLMELHPKYLKVLEIIFRDWV